MRNVVQGDNQTAHPKVTGSLTISAQNVYATTSRAPAQSPTRECPCQPVVYGLREITRPRLCGQARRSNGSLFVIRYTEHYDNAFVRDTAGQKSSPNYCQAKRQ
jgi:hypothetical protein